MQSPKEIHSFRLDKFTLGLLRAEARRRGMTESAIVESVLSTTLKMESFVQGFNIVSLGKETFRSILDVSQEGDLEKAGFQRGRKSFHLARELFESNGLELTYSQFVAEILGEQAHWFNAEGVYFRPERMTLQHGFGQKWSRFLAGYLSGVQQVVSKNTRLRLVTASDFVSIWIPQSNSN